MLLLDRIETWATELPEKVALSFLNYQGDIEDSVTYEELAQITSSLADNLLSSSDLKPGDRILLIYPPSLDFILSFIACLKARLTAVPLFPPDPRRLDKALTMFHAVTISCGAHYALTSASYNHTAKIASLKSFVPLNPTIQWPDLSWIVTDSLISKAKQLSSYSPTVSWKSRDHSSLAPSSPIFLQFASGSSSDPRGVIITEDNLDHNLSLIARSLQTNTNTVCASWLPQYHDMGLMCSYLGLIWCGGTGRYCSPQSFHRNPLLWITILSRYRATHTQAPDFAYALTTRKFLAMSNSQRKTFENDLDLSSLLHMINAGEPVRCGSIEMFEAVFGKFGLSSEIIFPSYGLAEHTFLVSSNGRSFLRLDRTELQKNKVKPVARATDSVVLMSSGNPTEFGNSVAVKIVKYDEGDGEGDERRPSSAVSLPEKEIGEIWINSASKASGYWSGTSVLAAQQEQFTMSLSDDDRPSSVALSDTDQSPPRYLRTGDLGFLCDGELYVCGPLDDVVISRGRKIYPQDIELSCEKACAELRNGRSAAFCVGKLLNSEESVVYVAELSEEAASHPSSLLSPLAEKIAGIGLQEHGVSLASVIFLAAETLPKATSGKAARQWAKTAHLAGELPSLFQCDTLTAQRSLALADQFSPTPATPSSYPGENPLESRGMAEEALLGIVTAAVEEIFHGDSSKTAVTRDLAPDHSLSSLGLDRAKLSSLQESLCRKFTTQLSPEILSDPDLTLRGIARALSMDGQLAPRPFLIEAWKLIDFLRSLKKFPVGRVPDQWLNENKLQANLLTHSFPDRCALAEAPLSELQDRVYISFALFACGVFFWLPAMGGLLFWTLPLPYALAAVVLFHAIVFTVPVDSWPPANRLCYLMKCAVDYFSVRVIIDSPHDTSTPSIYAMEPHGWLPIPQSIHQLLNEWVTGENFHLLAADSVFYMPVFNIIAKLQGCRPVDKKTFAKTLLSGRSVGVIPGGIAEMFEYLGPSSPTEVLKLRGRKGFVKLALMTGSQIVPCYTFGCWDTFQIFTSKSLQHYSRLTGIPLLLFWGRYYLPIPLRTPVLIAIGRPIRCPKVDNPTPELIDEFHERYLRETKSLFDKYKNAFGWGDKTLCLQK